MAIETQSEETQPVEKVVQTAGTTRFGLGQINNPTPTWVNWVFRTEFIINKAVLMVLGASTLFTANEVKESLIWIAAIDYIVWQLGRFVGVSKDQIEK